jgi:hypothetical protein
MSRELAPHVKSIVGVDISQGMVDQYNKRASDLGVLPERMTAICAELKGDGGELEGRKFDVIVVSWINFTTGIGDRFRSVTKLNAFSVLWLTTISPPLIP